MPRAQPSRLGRSANTWTPGEGAGAPAPPTSSAVRAGQHPAHAPHEGGRARLAAGSRDAQGQRSRAEVPRERHHVGDRRLGAEVEDAAPREGHDEGRHLQTQAVRSLRAAWRGRPADRRPAPRGAGGASGGRRPAARRRSARGAPAVVPSPRPRPRRAAEGLRPSPGTPAGPGAPTRSGGRASADRTRTIRRGAGAGVLRRRRGWGYRPGRRPQPGVPPPGAAAAPRPRRGPPAPRGGRGRVPPRSAAGAGPSTSAYTRWPEGLRSGTGNP